MTTIDLRKNWWIIEASAKRWCRRDQHELGMNKASTHVLEAIHSIYSADRIENKLFIKVSQIIVYMPIYHLLILGILY